jgi:membrane protease YdiL (CAAX protease family)
MKKNRFSLVAHPWLFMLVFLLLIPVVSILTAMFLVYGAKLPGEAPTFGFWLNVLFKSLMVFVIAPFVLGYYSLSHSYSAYLSEIRLTRWQPVLKLILLGVSCWLILALCQVACTLAYRLSQGGAIDLAFLRSAFPLGSEFPPQSFGWLNSTTSILEEITFRGMMLALFLRFYTPPKAVLFSALGFGAFHLLSLLDGAAPVWVIGMVIWATFLGIFYGFVTYKTGSLLPAMLVHYLGNLFIYPLTAYVQNNAPILVVVLFGITLTMGAVPVLLMGLWTRYFTSRWPMTREIPSEKIQVSEPYLGH